MLFFRLGPRATPRAEQIGELLKRSLSLDATEEEGQDGNGAKEVKEEMKFMLIPKAKTRADQNVDGQFAPSWASLDSDS